MFTKPRSIMRSTDIIIAVVAIIAVLAASCTSEGSSPEESTTTTTIAQAGPSGSGSEDLVFGSGSLPSTVPADFPIPEQAVIGSTLVDTPRGLTEAIVTYPADVTAVVDFFTANLPAFGYAVDASAGTDAKWEIDFSKDELSGVIIVSTAGPGLSQGALRIVIPVSS